MQSSFFSFQTRNRFSGQGFTCTRQSPRSVRQNRRSGQSITSDPEIVPASPLVAAGNAALLRQWSFLRSRGQNPPHPTELKPTPQAVVSPPTVSNTMAVSMGSASLEPVSENAVILLRVGAMIPADVDAIKVSLSDPQVDVSSDDSVDDDKVVPAAS